MRTREIRGSKCWNIGELFMISIITIIVLVMLACAVIKASRQEDDKDDYFGINKNPVLIVFGWLYTAFKWTIIAGLIVGIGISNQFRHQLIEICQGIRLCDK